MAVAVTEDAVSACTMRMARGGCRLALDQCSTDRARSCVLRMEVLRPTRQHFRALIEERGRSSTWH